MKAHLPHYRVEIGASLYDPDVAEYTRRVDEHIYVCIEDAVYTGNGMFQYTLTWKKENGKVCYVYGWKDWLTTVEALI